MRICFIAASSSIHVQRIVAYHLGIGDEILILSSGFWESYIAGTTTHHLLKTKPRAGLNHNHRPKVTKRILSTLKQIIPRSLSAAFQRTLRDIRLVCTRAFCLTEIERFNPDVIYCFRSFPEGMLAAFCSVRPLLLRTAGADISKYAQYPVYRQIIRKALCTADMVVTESTWEKRILADLCHGKVKAEVGIIGIDTNMFKPSATRQSLRDKYQLPRDAFVVVSSRYLRGDYHGWLVVQAIQAILQDCPNLFLLYLSPLPVDGRTKEKIETICSQYPQIRFIDGGVPQSQVAEILSCGDVYISLASVDGIPNSVLEAMACGCVPIVADLPQLHEWIESGTTGFIVPQSDRKKVSSLVKGLYQRPDDLTLMARQCVSKINMEGRFEVCMERTENMLKSLAIAASQEKHESNDMIDPSSETGSLCRWK